MKFNESNKVNEKYGFGSKWMSLQSGENKIRILSEFLDYGNHFDTEKKASVICVGKEICEKCREGDKPRVQFLGRVIDRTDNRIKLLRIGYKIFQQIGALASSADYAFDSTPDYDITVTKTGQGLDTEYSVLPARKTTELTSKELAEIEGVSTSLEDEIDRMKAKVTFAEPSSGVEGAEIPVIEDEPHG